MEIEALEAMNESMYLSLLMVIEVTVQIMILFAIAGFAVYLAAIAWLCFEEMRQPARRQMKPAAEPPEPDEHDVLAILAALDDCLDDKLTGGGSRRAPGVTTDFSWVSRQRQASASIQPEKNDARTRTRAR